MLWCPTRRLVATIHTRIPVNNLEEKPHPCDFSSGKSGPAIFEKIGNSGARLGAAGGWRGPQIRPDLRRWRGGSPAGWRPLGRRFRCQQLARESQVAPLRGSWQTLDFEVLVRSRRPCCGEHGLAPPEIVILGWYWLSWGVSQLVLGVNWGGVL